MYKTAILIFMIMTLPGKIEANQPDFVFMVEQAIEAPSGHNTQPWLFKINDNNIEIHPNFDKTLPVVDPDNRELFISLGCALENLCIAATEKGYKQQIEITETGIIKIFLSYSNIPPIDNSLFRQIPLRQTNRSVYNGNRIPAGQIAILQGLNDQEDIRIHLYENGTPDFDIIKDYVEQGNRQQMQDKAFKAELKEWMRFNKKHREGLNDGLSYQVFGAPNLPMFISKPIIGAAINEKSQVKGDHKKIDSASHLVLFTTRQNNLTEWIQAGQILQRFLLKTTELGIANSFFNQPNELPELSVKMRDALHLYDEYPTILIRIGYGNSMPYSKRKNIEQVLIN